MTKKGFFKKLIVSGIAIGAVVSFVACNNAESKAETQSANSIKRVESIILDGINKNIGSIAASEGIAQSLEEQFSSYKFLGIETASFNDEKSITFHGYAEKNVDDSIVYFVNSKYQINDYQLDVLTSSMDDQTLVNQLIDIVSNNTVVNHSALAVENGKEIMGLTEGITATNSIVDSTLLSISKPTIDETTNKISFKAKYFVSETLVNSYAVGNEYLDDGTEIPVFEDRTEEADSILIKEFSMELTEEMKEHPELIYRAFVDAYQGGDAEKYSIKNIDYQETTFSPKLNTGLDK